MLFREMEWLGAQRSDRLRWLICAGLIALAGCDRPEEIRRYTVDKPPPLAPLARINPHGPHGDVPLAKPPAGPPTDRTLGAIVTSSPQGWFFKLTGPADAVARVREAFEALLRSVRFDADGQPSWTLPEGWQEQPGSQFRFATLVIPAADGASGDVPLEVSVTALPNAGDDNDNYVLMNVNRWRGQLRLGPVSLEQLAGEATRIELDDAAITVVDLLGHAAPDGMTR